MTTGLASLGSFSCAAKFDYASGAEVLPCANMLYEGGARKGYSVSLYCDRQPALQPVIGRSSKARGTRRHECVATTTENVDHELRTSS